LPFGTALEIEGYGQCLVTDRMNSRFRHRVDIAMTVDEGQEARQFGLKFLKVRVMQPVGINGEAFKIKFQII